MLRQPIILFDGLCHLCDGTVNLLLRHDRKEHFLFASLQSEKGKTLLRQFGLNSEAPESIVLIDGEKAYQHSDAVLRIIGYLPWYFQPLQLGHVLPRSWRNRLYNWVARNRYRWFGKRERCKLPASRWKHRFIDL